MDVTRCDYSGATLVLYTIPDVKQKCKLPFGGRGIPYYMYLSQFFPYKEISTPIWGKRAIWCMFVKK